MYKRELFESMEEMLNWLNDNKIADRNIIAIMPFLTSRTDGEAQLRREYELVYKDTSNRGAKI